MEFPPNIRSVMFARKLLLALATVLLSGEFCVALASPGSASQDKPATSDKSNPQGKRDKKSGDDTPTTRLKIRVTGNNKPISNATVYVRFNVAGGFLHKDKLAELDLKTNEDGTAKVPDLPQGRVLIQVIAKDWHTYGKWYDVDGEEQTIEIKLEPPPKWY
jgi:hypothetical protein